MTGRRIAAWLLNAALTMVVCTVAAATSALLVTVVMVALQHAA